MLFLIYNIKNTLIVNLGISENNVNTKKKISMKYLFSFIAEYIISWFWCEIWQVPWDSPFKVFRVFSLRLGWDDVNDIVIQESVHFPFKLQSVSLEKHFNGFAVVHLLSVRPTSVSVHPLWDDRRERDQVNGAKRRVFYLPPYQHTSHAPPFLTVTGENLSGNLSGLRVLFSTAFFWKDLVRVGVSSTFRLHV